MKVKFNSLCLVTMLVLGMSGCTQKSSEESITAARKALVNGDQQTAIIELKNAIQNDYSNPSSRFLLGKIYLERGVPAAAEKELRQALKNGYDVDAVYPLLSKSLILQFKYKEVIDLVKETKGLSLEAATTLYTLQAQAYFQLDNPEAANEAILHANELSADSPYAKLGLAYAAFDKREINIALETVEELVKQQPEFTEALLLKGQLQNAKGNLAEALVHFQKYHQLHPELIQGRIYLADSYIKNKQYDNAEKLVDMMLKINGQSPFINQLKSQIKYESKDFIKAKHFAEIAITNGGQNQLTSTIAALSAYQIGLPEQAYRHLLTIVDTLPENHQLLGLFNVLEVTMGYNQEGISDPESLKNLGERNVSVLINSGMELAKSRKFEDAQKLLDVIDSDKISDPIELTRLSMLKLNLNINDKSAIADLQKVLETTPDSIEAKKTLARAYIADGKPEKALEIANSITESQPDSVEGYNLAGFVYATMNNFEDAKSMHQKVLAKSPNDRTANLFFGKLNLSEKLYDNALVYYRNIINQKPIYLPALVTYYQLEKLYGIATKAITPIEQAYMADKNNLQYALFYAKFLETEKSYTKALDVLRVIPTSAALPDAYWQLYIDIYIKEERREELETVLNKWVSTNPSSGLAWRSIASHYEKKNNIALALRHVEDGLKSATNGIDNLKVLQAQYLLYTNNKDKAQTVITELAKSHEQDNPVLSLLEGQMLVLNDNCPAAVPKLLNNYNFEASTKTLKIILNCYVDSGQKDKAIDFTSNHIESHPSDNTARLYLASLLTHQDDSRAERLYREVIETEPLNRVALNNLAIMLDEKGRSSEAVRLAKIALDKSPEEPYLIEIYATALLKNKNKDEAITMYAKAYNKSGKSKEYARFYVDALKATNNDIIAEKIRVEANL